MICAHRSLPLRYHSGQLSRHVLELGNAVRWTFELAISSWQGSPLKHHTNKALSAVQEERYHFASFGVHLKKSRPNVDVERAASERHPMYRKLSIIAAIAATFAVAELAVPSAADAYVRGGAYRGGAYRGGAYRGGAYRGGVYRGGAYRGGAYGYRGGVYRGGAYGYRGGVYRGAAVVGRPYYGGVWYGTGRRWWGGRWWPYGVGSCWQASPVGYVWVCG
jgi:hypothetical protein